MTRLQDSGNATRCPYSGWFPVGFHIALCLVISLGSASLSEAQPNQTCANMQAISAGGTMYVAGFDPGDPGPGNGPEASVLDPGNDYVCLLEQPNPTWFYGVVDNPGDIDLTITNTNNVDLDFMLWGPYADVPTAVATCGSLNQGVTTCPFNGVCNGTFCLPFVDPCALDCSFDPQATEVINIPSAMSGEVYVVLITNYSNTATTVSVNQTGGAGSLLGTITEPGISISGNGNAIDNGGGNSPDLTNATDLGSVNVASGTSASSFTILSDGGGTLSLTGTSPFVELLGAQAADFAVTQIPVAGPLAPSQTTTFEVTFDPSAVGTRSAMVRIANNDSDNDPFTFDIQGVGTAVPGFSKAFAPDGIAIGGISTLTFTVDNTANTVAATDLDFTDSLPAGLTVASPGNPSTTCTGGTLTAVSGSGTIAYTGGSVAASAVCTVQVDTTAGNADTFDNVSGILTSSLGSSGSASATLTVNPAPQFTKAFAPAAVAVGDVATLTFTVDNTASTVAATNLDFTDIFPAGLTVASPSNPSTTCIGGTLTAASGSGTVSYTGGSVAASSTCTVQVDTTADTADTFDNISGDLTSSLGNSGNAADTLTVNPTPQFSKMFAPAVVAVGGAATLTFTVDNTASTVAATSLDFTDNLPPGLTVASPGNPSTTCVGGTLTAVSGSSAVSYTGGSVAAAATCIVQVDTVTDSAGTYDNVSDDLTSSLGNSGSATDSLTAIGALGFTKTFSSNPVLPGGLVDVEFTLTNPSSGVSLADLAFTVDLDGVIAGLVTDSPSASDVCGGGSQTTGGSSLGFSGGNLGPSASCSFTVSLRLPADAVPGTYSCTTSDLSGTAESTPVSAPPASDQLIVEGLAFTKVFDSAGEEVIGGDTVNLTFVIANPDPVNAASNINFLDDLDDFVPGAQAIDVPQADICGPGSQLDGASLLSLTGASIGAGGDCTISTMVQIPATAAAGVYVNNTSPLVAEVGGNSVTGASADDTLSVASNILGIPTLGWSATLALVLLLSLGGAFALRRMN